jgi:hypothetical protein
MSDHIKLARGWKKINEAEMGIAPEEPEMVNVSFTKQELTVLRSLIQTAVSEMTSDPNSGMKGVPKEISAVVQKLDSFGQ